MQTDFITVAEQRMLLFHESLSGIYSTLPLTI